MKKADRVKELSSTYNVHTVPSKRPTLIARGPLLSVIIARDNGMFCGFCPELDIISELPSEAGVLQDMVEAIRNYAQEYKKYFRDYYRSSNRSHHWPYIKEILKTRSDWEIRKMFDIRYGDIHVQ